MAQDVVGGKRQPAAIDGEGVVAQDAIKKAAAPAVEEDSKGRRLVFKPTSETVTIVREKVGQTYNGDWIHEVVSKDGHKFLSSERQLK